MTHRTWKRTLALVLAVALLGVGLAACQPNEPAATSAATATTTATTKATTAATTTTATTAAPEPRNETPLVAAYGAFSQKFSPYFADTVYDTDVVNMVNLAILTTDRSGGIIYNAIKGETHEYNGTPYTYTGIADVSVEYDETADITTYTAKIRDDIMFSDGHMMDADDIIFNYYVFLDPSYVGSATLNSYPIIGLTNYLYNNSKAEGMDVDALLAAPDESFTTELTEFVKSVLVDEMAWVKTLYGNASYKTYTDKYPVAKDLMYSFYGTDSAYDSSKVESEDAVMTKLFEEYGADWVAIGDAYGASFEPDIVKMAYAYLSAKATGSDAGEEVPNIAGIKKLDQYTVQVQTKGYSAPAIYSIFGIEIAPMHYYGDEKLYNYDANQFGFPRGDLSIIQAKSTQPMGAGPYKFVKYENKVVYFESNEKYYNGEPKTPYVQFIETADADMIPSLSTGTADVATVSGSKTNFSAIREKNTNGEPTGNVITTNSVDYRGYGYLGLNAATINVGGEPASEASKNLRRAIATLLAVQRDVAVDSFYGDAATVINYPISNTSWAAPQKSDADYQVAFSVDVDGKPIFTAGMSADDRYKAALDAAIGFFKAAGYTWDAAAGKFTAAPAGAKMEYEFLIPGNGTGNHPNFMILTNAKAALESIGLNLIINDLSDSSLLWERLDAGTQEMWTAAWQATIDPDMYQVYHSSGIVGRGGSDSNHYQIDDPELDALIVKARESDDQSYRKAVYKSCLDLVIDWAVEIPSYQRQNIVIFSSERIKTETITPDITTYWGWMQDIELLEMK